MIKSAASAASLDYVKFQAVIKSAASAASPKAKSREGSSRGAPDDGARWDDGDGRATGDGRTTERGTPLDLGFLDFGFPGGCASSRLDHGLKFYVIQGGCASSRLISEFSDCARFGCSQRLEQHLEGPHLVLVFKGHLFQ